MGEPVRQFNSATILAPAVNQEVWAAGVTYYRSRNARIEESKEAGGGNFYDRVYAAERPELFFKATGSRVVGPNQAVRIRSDAKMVRTRTRVDPADQSGWKNCGLYDWQRYERA